MVWVKKMSEKKSESLPKITVVRNSMLHKFIDVHNRSIIVSNEIDELEAIRSIVEDNISKEEKEQAYRVMNKHVYEDLMYHGVGEFLDEHSDYAKRILIEFTDSALPEDN